MKQHCPGLLLFRLHRHKAHGRALRRLADRLRVRSVVLVPLHIGLHVHRRDQPHVVAEPRHLPAPMVSARASLHRHRAARLRNDEIEQLSPTQLPAKRHRSIGPSSINLKAALRQIDPDDANLFHGCLLLQGVRMHHHLGTSRCRREEASTPSFLSAVDMFLLGVPAGADSRIFGGRADRPASGKSGISPVAMAG